MAGCLPWIPFSPPHKTRHPVILALGRRRQEDDEFKAILSYKVEAFLVYANPRGGMKGKREGGKKGGKGIKEDEYG